MSSLGLLVTTAIWGSTFFIIKDAVSNINPLMLLFERFGLAAIIVGTILLWQRQNLFKNIRSGLLLGVIQWVGFLVQTVGLVYTSASNSGFITGLFIFFIPIFAFLFFKKRPTKAQLVSLATALVGLWFLTGGLSHINAGDLLTLANAVDFALFILVADNMLQNKGNPNTLNFQQFFTVSVLSILSVAVFHLPTHLGSITTQFSIAYLAIGATVVAIGLQLAAQKHLNPFTAAVLLSMEPVFAAVFSWTLGHEVFVPLHALGGVFIVIAAIIAGTPPKNNSYKHKL